MKTITLINPLYRKRYLKTLPNQFDHLFLTFDQALVQKDGLLLKKRLLNFYQAFQQYPQLNLFKPVQKHFDTAQQFLRMLDLMDMYQIKISDLPEANAIEKEKKDILAWMMTLELYRPYLQRKALPYDRLQVTSNLYSVYQSEILKDAKKIEPEKIEAVNKLAFKALNPSQEIEAVAQYIASEQLTDVLILHGDLANASHDLIRFFSQYQLDFQISYPTVNTTNLIFLQLVKLSQEPNLTNLIELLKYFPFGQTQEEHDLLIYLKQFLPNFESLPQLNTIENHNLFKETSPQDYHNLRRLEQSAQRALQRWYHHLQILDKDQPLTSSFTVLNLTQSPKRAIIDLKNQLESLYEEKESEVDTEILENLLSKEQYQMIEGENIVIGSLRDIPPMNFKTIILMGLNHNNYPLNDIYTGIFDELYLSKVSEFPSLELRQEQLNKQLEPLFQRSETLIYSSHRISFDGKTVEQSYELDAQLQKDNLTWQDWNYIQNPGKSLEIETLEPDYVDDLVFKNGLLKGSISSFETYFNCSYQYFVEYILYIREPRAYTTDVAFIGSISHEVLESVVRDYPDNYYELSPDKLEPYLESYRQILFDLYPNKRFQFDHIFKLLTNNIKVTLNKLKTIEPLRTYYRPFENEYKFSNVSGFDPDDIIRLTGFIDRIDIGSQGLIILDYKSSDMNLSITNIYNGQQLQLILYGEIASRTFEKPLVGVYYISLLNSFNSVDLIKHSKRPYKFNFNWPIESKPIRLNGYNFEESQLGEHTMKQIKDLPAIIEIYKTRFKEMIDELQQGKIDTNRQLDRYFNLRNLQRYKESPKKYLKKSVRDAMKFTAYSYQKKA